MQFGQPAAGGSPAAGFSPPVGCLGRLVGLGRARCGGWFPPAPFFLSPGQKAMGRKRAYLGTATWWRTEVRPQKDEAQSHSFTLDQISVT